MLTRKFRRKWIVAREDLAEFFQVLISYFKELRALVRYLPVVEIKVSRDLPQHVTVHRKSKSNYFFYLRQAALLWIIPLTIAAVSTVMITPASAQMENFETRLSQYTVDHTPIVGSEPVGEKGFEQIYYLFEDKKYYLTDEDKAHGAPSADLSQVAWMTQIDGTWQIFMYNLNTKKLLQLTHGGNNVNPKITNGSVVWQGWIDGTWQVFLYDGKSIAQLTSGDASVDPEISGNYIVYNRRDKNDLWRASGYSITEKKEIDIAVGNEYKKPILDGLTVKYGGEGRQRFPLTIEDMFTLKLGSLQLPGSETSAATYDSILAELLSAQASITPVPAAVQAAETALSDPEAASNSGTPIASVSAVPQPSITPGL